MPQPISSTSISWVSRPCTRRSKNNLDGNQPKAFQETTETGSVTASDAGHGHPRSGEDAARLPFVGSDRQGRYLGYLRAHGLPVNESNFSCYVDQTVAHWALVPKSLGIGAMMDEIACDTGCGPRARRPATDQVPGLAGDAQGVADVKADSGGV